MLGKLTWSAIPWDQPIPLVAGSLVFSIGIAVVVWIVAGFSERLRENRIWLRAVSVDQASATTIDLFNRAQKAKLIHVIRDARRLDIGVARCENLLHPVDGDPAAHDCTATYWRANQRLAVATVGRDHLSLQLESAMESGDMAGLESLLRAD